MFPTFTSLQLLLSSHQTVLYTFQTLCFKKRHKSVAFCSERKLLLTPRKGLLHFCTQDYPTCNA